MQIEMYYLELIGTVSRRKMQTEGKRVRFRFSGGGHTAGTGDDEEECFTCKSTFRKLQKSLDNSEHTSPY
jgi:hypothetical protein